VEVARLSAAAVEVGAGGKSPNTPGNVWMRFVKLIQETIDPTSWRDAGGSVGGIPALSGQYRHPDARKPARMVI